MYEHNTITCLDLHENSLHSDPMSRAVIVVSPTPAFMFHYVNRHGCHDTCAYELLFQYTRLRRQAKQHLDDGDEGVGSILSITITMQRPFLRAGPPGR
jgi:hypothetical protein